MCVCVCAHSCAWNAKREPKLDCTDVLVVRRETRTKRKVIFSHGFTSMPSRRAGKDAVGGTKGRFWMLRKR